MHDILRIQKLFFGLLLMLVLVSCSNETKNKAKEQSDNLIAEDYADLKLPKRPNILWLVAEDLSPYLPSFGDSTISTPNLSRLTKEGVVYTNLYSPSGVCAPSRAAIATGMYPTHIGAQHMRTGPWWSFDYEHGDPYFQGKQIYEAMPPEGVHMHSEYLRRAGYYCTNNAKEDYQFRSEMTAWDESGDKAHWRNRDKDQPFFAIFNFMVTHESKIWTKESDSLWVNKNLPISLPPYLQNTESSRKDMRRMYSNIKEMDHQIGKILYQLEDDGELENTIIFWYSDHGGSLPRSKRTLYDSGIKAPMIIRFPNAQIKNKKDNQLLSFVDLKPTLLSLAGIEIPDYVDGSAWMGKYQSQAQREYIHASADNFDACCKDRVRAVRDQRFKYIRNYLTDKPYYLPISFRENMATMKELLILNEQKELNEIQAQWFRKKKDYVELFDTYNDPFELVNLADNPSYNKHLQELSAEMDSWINAIDDKGMLLEKDYVQSIWPNNKQPITLTPTFKVKNDLIAIDSETKGAAIGYQWLNKNQEPNSGWEIYQGPIEIMRGKKLVARAHRIGFVPSALQSKTIL